MFITCRWSGEHSQIGLFSSFSSPCCLLVAYQCRFRALANVLAGRTDGRCALTFLATVAGASRCRRPGADEIPSRAASVRAAAGSAATALSADDSARAWLAAGYTDPGPSTQHLTFRITKEIVIRAFSALSVRDSIMA